jgi:hypothetical protein
VRRDVNFSDFILREGKNTIPLIEPHPIRLSSSTRRTFMGKQGEGSQRIRKYPTKDDDFITQPKVFSWQKSLGNNNITEYYLREAFKLTAGNILDANNKDTILRFLCRTTLFNNQLDRIFPGEKPAWYSGPNCYHCEQNVEVGIIETLQHPVETCSFVGNLKTDVLFHFGIEVENPRLTYKPQPQYIVGNY